MRPLATLSPLPGKLTRAAQLAYGLAAFIATAAIWGWAIDLPRLRDLGADFAPMAPGEALAFLLLASSFYASHRDDYRSRRAAYSAAAVAGAIGLFGLVEALSGESLGMSFGVAAMSSATCIMVLALALVTPLARDFKLVGLSANGSAAGAIGAVAFFALLGASLRVLRFDIGAPLLALSAPGAVAALLAAFALAMGRPTPWLIDTLSSRRTGAVVTRWLLPAAFFVPMTIGWIRLLAEREGLFGEAFGMSLFTFIIIGTFSALVLWVARTLDRIAAQRAQAEVQADEQREWLQVTLAAIGDGVIATDGGGRVRFLNAAAQRLTGWRADEAGGRPVAELLSLFDERDGRTIESPLQMALRRRSAICSGLSIVLPSRSSNSDSSSATGRPPASSARQPVSRCAAALRKRTRPPPSVAITPSPMAASVTWSHSRCSSACTSACARCAAMRSSVRATHSTSALNVPMMMKVKSDMPKASPNRPSRSASRRIQPIVIGTKNAAGSSQRVTTAPVRLLESVSISHGVGRPMASANAASRAATAPGADSASSGAPMSKRSTRRLAPRSAKKATAPIAPAALPLAERPTSLKSRASGVTSASASTMMQVADDIAATPKLMPRDSPLSASTKPNRPIAPATAAAL